MVTVLQQKQIDGPLVPSGPLGFSVVNRMDNADLYMMIWLLFRGSAFIAL